MKLVNIFEKFKNKKTASFNILMKKDRHFRTPGKIYGLEILWAEQLSCIIDEHETTYTWWGTEFGAWSIALSLPFSPLIFTLELDEIRDPGVGQSSYIMVLLPAAVGWCVVTVSIPHHRLAISREVVVIWVGPLSTCHQVSVKISQPTYIIIRYIIW